MSGKFYIKFQPLIGIAAADTKNKIIVDSSEVLVLKFIVQEYCVVLIDRDYN